MEVSGTLEKNPKFSGTFFLFQKKLLAGYGITQKSW